jgi:hypothetical protein
LTGEDDDLVDEIDSVVGKYHDSGGLGNDEHSGGSA